MAEPNQRGDVVEPDVVSTTTANVHNGILEVQGAAGAVTTLDVGSPQWHAWLEANRAFRFSDKAGSFGARKERRGRHWYWYAYRNIRGVVRLTYLGKPNDVTWERMITAARNYEHLMRSDAERDSTS